MAQMVRWVMQPTTSNRTARSGGTSIGENEVPRLSWRDTLVPGDLRCRRCWQMKLRRVRTNNQQSAPTHHAQGEATQLAFATH